MASKYLDYEGLQRLVTNIDAKYAPKAALLFKSTVEDIEHLPSLDSVQVGWMYSISTGGGTNSTFKDGAGHIIGNGENVAAVEVITGYTEVTNPDGSENPAALGWYELVDTKYVLSEDSGVISGKTYYTVETGKKWDTLGGFFNLADKYLELGEEFPQNAEDGQNFIYFGEDKYVYVEEKDPEGNPSENGYYEGTFTQASTTGVINPKEVPLYELNAETNEYVRSTDTVVDPEKIYYEGTFEQSTDTEVNPEKTYYNKENLYNKGGIYEYDDTDNDWHMISGGSGNNKEDIISITNKEIDDLFI